MSQEAAPEAVIPALLVEFFDRPEAHVAIGPVVVEDDVAIAGWVQDGAGGRALLRRKEGAWMVILCGGDALKESASLQEIGLSKAKADALTAKLSAAESALSPFQRALLSQFDGLVVTDVRGNHTSLPVKDSFKP